MNYKKRRIMKNMTLIVLLGLSISTTVGCVSQDQRKLEQDVENKVISELSPLSR